LQSKYQKLATEYSKLRAQVPVLKKAVLDEQSTTQSFRDVVKEREQTIRRYEQEIESLTFRNKQLTSRVEVLQVELENVGIKTKKSKGLNLFKSSNANANRFAPPEPVDGTDVLGEELQNKIQENAMLHTRLNESEGQYNEELSQLQSRLSEFESAAGQHATVLQTTRAQSRQQLDRLTEDKAVLEAKLQKHEKESREFLLRAETAEECLRVAQTDLKGRLTTATTVMQDKLPFNDTSSRVLTALNVPTHDRQHQVRTRDIAGQAAVLIKQLTQALSNLHTYTEQRSQIYPADQDQEPLSDINRKFCQYLHENAAYLRPIDQAYKKFVEELNDDALTTLETAVGLRHFADTFKKYVAYASKLLPYHLMSIEEECSVSVCTQALEAKNLQVHCTLQRFHSMLVKVQSYVSLIAQQSDGDCDHPRSSQTKLFELLAKSAVDFHEAVKELSKQFNAKVYLEHQLPTASTKLKTTDECIVSSLVTLVTCTSKLSAFLTGNLEFFNQNSGYRTRGSSQCSALTGPTGPRSHPSVASFRQKAANYLSTLCSTCPECVPYEVAIHNRRTLLSSTESRSSLAQQVVSLQSRLGQLESEREHWMLETQLMQMKYEKEQQRCRQLNSSGDVANTETTDTGDRMRADTKSNLPTDVSMLGVSESTHSGDSSGQVKFIKDHFTQRISEQTRILQLGDSKALNFQAECRALHKRLSIAQKLKDTLTNELSSTTQTKTAIKDELQTTTKSYESQLSMMSEHLASMNEKLASQNEEIEALKYQIHTNSTYNAKAAKKGKK